MRRTAVLSALLCATASLGAVASDHAEPRACVDDPTRTVELDGTSVPVQYCQTTLFAQCTDADPAAGKVVLPTDAVTLAETPPSGSFTAGEGCGTVDEPVFGNTQHAAGPYHYFLDGFALEGGNLDTLTLEAHFLGPNVGYAGQEVALDVRITVDGVSLFGTEEGTSVAGDPFAAPAQRRITVVPEVSDTGASSRVVFTVTGLADLDPRFADAAGPGDRFRQVAVGLNLPHTGDCAGLPPNGTERCVPFGPAQLVMGADEIPTGVVLNAAEPATVTVEAGEQD